jgi:hypothetical protein
MSTVRQQLEVTTPSPARDRAPVKSPRDVQREALHDLVALATESATTEAEIESRWRVSTEQAAKEFEKTQYSLVQRMTAARAALAEKHQQRASELHAAFMEEVAEAKQGHIHVRARIERDHEPIDHKAREQLEQAIWLADSVLEVAENQIRAEDKKVREQVKTHADAIDGIEQQAAKLLLKYNVLAPPEPEQTPQQSLSPSEDPQADMARGLDACQAELSRLRRLFLINMFVGWVPWAFVVVTCALAGIIAQASMRSIDLDFKAIAISVGSTLVGVIVLGVILLFVAKRQVRDAYEPLRQSIGFARGAADDYVEASEKQQEIKHAAAVRKRDKEVRGLKEKAAPVIEGVAQKRAEDITAADNAYKRLQGTIASRRDHNHAEAERESRKQSESLDKQHADDLDAARLRRDTQISDSRRRYDESRVALERRLMEGLTSIQAPIGDHNGDTGQLTHDWTDPYWSTWSPPRRFPTQLRFGQLYVDLKMIADNSKRGGEVKLQLPAPFSVPAALAFPRGASLMVQHERSGREQAMRLLQTVMTRVLTALPPGRARFTIIDPVGLGQNFAGFMHLADHDEALIGTRIWTESDQIEQRLADMTEHMETVIQKYLRNEFETIDEYNAQAGELAEPYRFLVIGDFPNSFQGDSFRRLASIAATGARCGVYVLVARDMRVTLPTEATLDDLEAHCVNLVQEGDHFIWKDDVFAQFPLTLDAPPPESVLTQLLDRVGKAARESKRVEVDFDTIAPAAREFWTGDSTDELAVPIGRMGATRLQMLRFGRGVAQHALIAGKTGSGKSTLLHALVTNLAMWYSPDHVELYLIDFKKGVEFKTYATHNLPHARAIAVESDREFGVSVLQRLDGELGRRGELFRKAGVQDLASYRKTKGAVVMPRTLLVIDEFQEFFSEDDRLAQEAGLLLDRLVRQGRAFGIHLLLGSQTIAGTSGLARSTIGQMAVRIALQTSEADSQLILGDNNSAARLLSRPGEAIYNDAGGLVEGNSPFQVAWLPDERREVYLENVRSRANAGNFNHDPALVFEGNASADIRLNGRLARLLEAKQWPAVPPASAVAWLGDPVAIKEPTALTLRRQSGSNVLIVGQQEEQAMAAMASTLISLAAQYQPGKATFYVLDGTPADSQLTGTFARIKTALPQDVRLVEWRAVGDAINEIAEQVAVRQEGDPAGQPEIFLFLYALQRYRILRRSDDDYGFSMGGDEPKKANPAKQFADILRDGPAVGIHIITWVDTIASTERTLDRTSMREFDHRILFQMSSTDSSTLIDSPAGNKLGFHRALAYSEEQGVIEKFRPYALPANAWLQEIAKTLRNRA